MYKKRSNIKKSASKLYSLVNTENWKKYRSVRRETKKAISETRFKAFEGFYQALENQEWRTANI